MAWAPVAALRERRLLVETGSPLHTLVRAIPFQTVRDLLAQLPDGKTTEWEIAADGTRSQGMPRRLTGQVETLLAVTSSFTLDYQRWVPAAESIRADPTASTQAPHPARHRFPADGGPVLIGYLITLTNSHTANQIR